VSKRYRNSGVRNKLEEKALTLLAAHGFDQSCYESEALEYEKPATQHTYTPDFKIGPDVYLETKGLFDREDRKKILLVLDQHPDVVVCMAFYNAEYKLYKGSPTTYGEWCNQHCIPWCDLSREDLPAEWFMPAVTNEGVQDV
jgi:hypothetical protein